MSIFSRFLETLAGYVESDECKEPIFTECKSIGSTNQKVILTAEKIRQIRYMTVQEINKQYGDKIVKIDDSASAYMALRELSPSQLNTLLNKGVKNDG